MLNTLEVGIDLGDERVCILLFEDDVVLLAENAQDLQILLDCLSS